jgi:hypothetical protein
MNGPQRGWLQRDQVMGRSLYGLALHNLEYHPLKPEPPKRQRRQKSIEGPGKIES